MLEELSEYSDKLYGAILALDAAVADAPKGNGEETAKYFSSAVIAKMQTVREYADRLETITAKEYWPFPTYGDLLFGVR